MRTIISMHFHSKHKKKIYLLSKRKGKLLGLGVN